MHAKGRWADLGDEANKVLTLALDKVHTTSEFPEKNSPQDD